MKHSVICAALPGCLLDPEIEKNMTSIGPTCYVVLVPTMGFIGKTRDLAKSTSFLALGGILLASLRSRLVNTHITQYLAVHALQEALHLASLSDTVGWNA